MLVLNNCIFYSLDLSVDFLRLRPTTLVLPGVINASSSRSNGTSQAILLLLDVGGGGGKSSSSESSEKVAGSSVDSTNGFSEAISPFSSSGVRLLTTRWRSTTEGQVRGGRGACCVSH